MFKVIQFGVKLSKYNAYKATNWNKPHCVNGAFLQPIVEKVTGPKRQEIINCDKNKAYFLTYALMWFKCNSIFKGVWITNKLLNGAWKLQPFDGVETKGTETKRAGTNKDDTNRPGNNNIFLCTSYF